MAGSSVARFGTDGVRGLANEQITAELAVALGRATARVFPSSNVVIGRDTRRSGPMLESAVAAGVCAEGADARLAGVVPTPAVAAAAARDGVPGIVISASHNPYADNGIKVFGPGGRKLTDAEQRAVEDAAAVLSGPGPHPGVTGAAIGTVRNDPTVLDAYLDDVAAALEGRDLAGVKVVLDCANGANSVAAPLLFERLGAEATVIAAAPDGLNINDACGSTHPEACQDAVCATGADAGIAFDGDADRVLAVGHDGSLVDGDQILALAAADLLARGRLADDTVVVTVMSNLGFRRAMTAAGITVVETAVGDRHVLEALSRGGYSLGGEQSGHIIFGDLSTTGDGLLAAILLLDLTLRAERSLAELAADAMTHLPQVLVNVRVATPVPDVADRLSAEIDAVQSELGDDGRVLLRPSGTEPVVRVMVEATEADVAADAADRLAAAVAALS
ncbi:MAG: phosphoglucosamine mutase [Actinomycetota bacterium]|nr:phosphoglucosamine mutase [Actinomycetota bacterium]